MRQGIHGLRMVGLTLLAGLWGPVEPVPAVDLAKETSLRLVPQEADFFASGLRLREQWAGFLASPVVQAMRRVPVVEKAVQEWSAQWDEREGQLGQARETLENPNVGELLTLVQTMFSDEFFIFGDQQFSDLLYELTELNDDMLEIMAGGDAAELSNYFLEMPKAEFDAFPIPTLVAGFKVDNDDLVQIKLDQLAGIIRFGLGNIPLAQSLIEGLERVEDQRGVRLVWTVTPEMVPWTAIAQSQADEQVAAMLEKLQDLVDGRQLVVTIGQLDEYLVFAVSEDSEAVTALGEGPSLAAHPALKPVVDRSTERLTSISFVSDHYAKAQFDNQLDRFFSRQLGQQYYLVASASGEIPPEFQTIPEDLAWIDDQIGEHVPESKGVTSFSFLTDSGSEMWTYGRTQAVLLDHQQKLDVLQHTGGNPMGLLALRLQHHPEYFATMRRLVRKVKSYLDFIPGLDVVDSEDQEKWRLFLEDGWPFLERLADLWEEEFLPAMKDGQHAWVLDGGELQSRQWFQEMPPSSTPLALPEMATITGISDREQMIEAFRSFFDICDQIVDQVRELEPETIPQDYSVPRPERVDANGSERFAYPIPEDFPVPKELAPQVMLSDDYLIASYSGKQLETLERSQPLKIADGVIQLQQPQGFVAYLDLGRIADFLRPWVAYAIEQQTGTLDAELVEAEENVPAIRGSDVLDIWGALGKAGRVTSSISAGPGGGSITRTVFEE